jgi:hypothetical protein
VGDLLIYSDLKSSHKNMWHANLHEDAYTSSCKSAEEKQLFILEFDQVKIYATVLSVAQFALWIFATRTSRLLLILIECVCLSW